MGSSGFRRVSPIWQGFSLDRDLKLALRLVHADHLLFAPADQERVRELQ
jgi:hypothetical protein